MPAEATDHCNDKSLFYFQAPCVIPSENIKPRLMKGLVVGCIGVFIYLYIMIYVEYVSQV